MPCSVSHEAHPLGLQPAQREKSGLDSPPHGADDDDDAFLITESFLQTAAEGGALLYAYVGEHGVTDIELLCRRSE